MAARVCQYELNGLTPEHYDEIRELRHHTNEVFRDAVARGVADGTFAQIDVNRVVRGMLSLGIDLVRWYRLDGHRLPRGTGRVLRRSRPEDGHEGGAGRAVRKARPSNGRNPEQFLGLGHQVALPMPNRAARPRRRSAHRA